MPTAAPGKRRNVSLPAAQERVFGPNRRAPPAIFDRTYGYLRHRAIRRKVCVSLEMGCAGTVREGINTMRMVIIIIIIAALAFFGWKWYSGQNEDVATAEPAATEEAVEETAADDAMDEAADAAEGAMDEAADMAEETEGAMEEMAGDMEEAADEMAEEMDEGSDEEEEQQ